MSDKVFIPITTGHDYGVVGSLGVGLVEIKPTIKAIETDKFTAQLYFYIAPFLKNYEKEYLDHEQIIKGLEQIVQNNKFSTKLENLIDE